MALPRFSKECFFITPIGAPESLERLRSDAVLKHIVKPAAEAVGLTVVRADQIAEPGHITLQVVEHCVKARAAVCDLTDVNPNVLYELGLRHARELPTVLISQTEGLPFDIAQLRTLFFDQGDLNSAMACKDELEEFLRSASSSGFKGGDSPVAYVKALEALREGSTQDRSLASLLGGMEKLLRNVAEISDGVDELKRRPDDDEVDWVDWTTEDHEVEVLAWAATALSMLGSEMRAIVMARLGFGSSKVRPAKEVAAEFNVPVREVDQLVRTAYRVWTSESFAELARGARANDLRPILAGRPPRRPQRSASDRQSD